MSVRNFIRGPSVTLFEIQMRAGCQPAGRKVQAAEFATFEFTGERAQSALNDLSPGQPERTESPPILTRCSRCRATRQREGRRDSLSQCPVPPVHAGCVSHDLTIPSKNVEAFRRACALAAKSGDVDQNLPANRQPTVFCPRSRRVSAPKTRRNRQMRFSARTGSHYPPTEKCPLPTESRHVQRINSAKPERYHSEKHHLA